MPETKDEPRQGDRLAGLGNKKYASPFKRTWPSMA
jgi:hypothetical protein